MSGDQDDGGSVADNDVGGYYIEDGKINTITKPKIDKIPKTYADAVRV